MTERKHLCGLYVITDPALTPPATIVSRCADALNGGARIIQLRDKSADHGARLAQAFELGRLCRTHDAVFIINDDARLAAECGADGVHIGREDHALTEARALLGEQAIIGVSCYNELERALDAEQQGADYIAFGRFYPSNTKPGAVQATPSLLEQARKRLSIPVAAIGGITAANTRPLIDAGADMVAVIEGVFGRPSPEQAARQIASHFRDCP